MSGITFSFDDKLYNGHHGEPMAAALLRCGLLSITNSTYHGRARGVIGLGVEEPNALVQLVSGTKESMRPATVIEVVEGLAARSLTGIGALPEDPEEARYDKTNRYVDTLVIGAGIAGLTAADEELRAGREVLLIDDQPGPGGHLRHLGLELPSALQGMLAHKNLTYLSRCTAVGLYDQNYVVAIERRSDHPGNAAPANRARIRVWHIRAERVVLAPGAFQRPLIFANNDRPGIMLSHAAATYVAVHGVKIFKQVVVATVDNQGYRDALRLHTAGVSVQGIYDVRSSARGVSVDAAKAAGIPIRVRSTVLDTSSNAEGVLNSVTIQDLETKEIFQTAADLLAVSGGWTPIVDLATHIGIKPKWSEEHAAFLVNHATDQLRTAGMLAGDFGGDDDPAVYFGPTLDAEQARHAYIDFQRDTTLHDLRRAVGAGLLSIEHIKRYTTIGTAHDQGKTSGMLTIGALCQLNGKDGLSPAEVGTLSFRPPYVPIPFAALAGRERGALSDPIRITALHQWHVEAGAVFEDVGQWKRPWYFPKAGESMDEAVRRECVAARQGVAVMDASTLGKIDIRGADAGIFLDRIYTNMFSTLPEGQCRYGLMCKADGIVFDDGVTTRLGKNHFLMTTTTGGAARVLAWLEEWLQTEWPELEVYCTSVTEHISTIALVGPKSRQLLHELVKDIDLSKDAFPFMHNRDATIDGIPVRIARISFSGELAFEINSTWGDARHIWERLWTLGRAYDLTAYGTETMHVLRAEKGYVIIGQDTDGTQTPPDLNMSWIVSKKKEFIGKRSLQLPYLKAAGRQQLVGLIQEKDEEVIPEGAYITVLNAQPDQYNKTPHTGFVTSAYYSPALGRSFALALVADGLNRMGEVVAVPIGKKLLHATICNSVFIDKENIRRD
ncbi:glycine cleavage T C-terminal barrel domain-containing protein [Agriterribacter sp.]|uniref:glycine cleavage T C-terminal barrel domain-containing protein n=2 Tax=Agriterribacter sp. TaxID=2821509 RepID=UPI002C619D28|nr:glycine cleavage T C-terminal barrel domain-containing protein [Agriterribacter sp.]HRO44807.1 glycine cleavage T C-terminal barrel domain-containing protein [Agriterribacter sp.]